MLDQEPQSRNEKYLNKDPICVILGGSLSIMWGHGTGSEVLKRIAAPMVGGMVSATRLCLIVIPAIYAFVLEHRLKKTEDFNE